MAAWVAHGDASGRHIIRPQFVESMVELAPTLTGLHRVKLHMISGSEFYVYFSDKEEVAAFIDEWGGELRVLDIEAVIDISDDVDESTT